MFLNGCHWRAEDDGEEKDCFWDIRRMGMVEEETDLLDKEKEFRETYSFSFNNHTGR